MLQELGAAFDAVAGPYDEDETVRPDAATSGPGGGTCLVAIPIAACRAPETNNRSERLPITPGHTQLLSFRSSHMDTLQGARIKVADPRQVRRVLARFGVAVLQNQRAGLSVLCS